MSLFDKLCCCTPLQYFLVVFISTWYHLSISPHLNVGESWPPILFSAVSLSLRSTYYTKTNTSVLNEWVISYLIMSIALLETREEKINKRSYSIHKPHLRGCVLIEIGKKIFKLKNLLSGSYLPSRGVRDERQMGIRTSLISEWLGWSVW